MSIKDIRANPELFRLNQISRFCDPKLVDQILEEDARYLKNYYKVNRLNQIKNMISNLISKKSNTSDKLLCSVLLDELVELVQNNKATEANELLNNYSKNNLIILSKFVSKSIATLDANCDKRDALIDKLSNVLDQNVPIHDNEDFNTVICEKQNSDKKQYNHVTLCEKLGILDTVTGSKLSGNRCYFLTGLGVKLNMALMSYAMDFVNKRNYKSMYVPHFLNPEVMAKLCQLSDFNETLYKVSVGENSDKFLIATSEQPLTGYYMDHKFGKTELPVRFAGISTCYRKEVGRHGVDTLGMFRVHQFEKVEQLCLTTADTSSEMFNEMINNAKEFYDSLGLSYRVVAIVSGALNNAAAIKYDLEGYFTGSGTYRELVSCSNCTDFFSRRLNITDHSGNYVHILNSTLCANTRTLCCILEQFQDENGVQIPEVLKPYLHDPELTHIPFVL